MAQVPRVTSAWAAGTDSAAAFRPRTLAPSMPSGAVSPRTARSHLTPEDAFHAHATSPPRRLGELNGYEPSARLHPRADSRSRRPKPHGPRRKQKWKKILWVKQSYPDNYTDQSTFLDSLQRNPRLQPYEFWPLVGDTTVIVQQVCSVIIFVVCFVGIFQERVSPVAVVGWGTFATFVGWLIWDWWVGQEGKEQVPQRQSSQRGPSPRQLSRPDALDPGSNLMPSAATSLTNSPNTIAERNPPHSSQSVATMRHLAGGSTTSLQSAHSQHRSMPADAPGEAGLEHRPSSPRQEGKATLRASTMKSAVLIYFTILGLSPILKSLTRSTSPDSIWAMSFWLLAINIFFFDYSGGVGVKFPASLSTNAALMASTVLASRLPSTGQVFSLTLFSIEVFGLFPVFRRYARHRSWRYHVVLSVLLVIGAGGGMGLILGEPKDGVWPWRSGLMGVVVGVLIAVIAMGASSWWLIGLQKYKNAMNGPWDLARPIIISRRYWDDE